MSDFKFSKSSSSLSKKVLLNESSVQFYKLDKITKQTDDEYLLRFNVPIEHNPAQFMQVSILGIGEAPISICSYGKDFFEMSVRSVGNVSAHICRLKAGDMVGLRGPYGNGYNMEYFLGNNVIVVGGGCGTAPVRGVIEYVSQNRDRFGYVDVFFGYRTHNDMLFAEDFPRWKKHNINMSIVLSEESNYPNTKSGFVTDILDCEATASNENKVVIICGPPVMIKATCKKLIDKGFNKDQIYFSEERHMKCGVGRCGHCMIGDKYCCTDGPVFRYDQMEGYTD